jgi:ribonuclease HI
MACGFFDGALTGNPCHCGAGGALYISKQHQFTFACGVGVGTNNRAELRGVEILMRLTEEKGVNKHQVYCDSLIVIWWMNGEAVGWNKDLNNLLREALGLKGHFHHISLCHVYKENN